MDETFADRLRRLCNDYYYDCMDTPPCPVSSYERMNSLLKGTRKPTMDELVKISEAYDVSINYLLTGDWNCGCGVPAETKIIAPGTGRRAEME